MNDAQLAFDELRAALQEAAKLERTRPSRVDVTAAVAKLARLAGMNCGGADDLRRFLPALIGPRGLIDSALDAENERAVLIVVHWILASGDRAVLAPLDRFVE